MDERSIEAARMLEICDEFREVPGMPKDVETGLLNVEHPANVGWLLSALLRVAGASEVSSERVLAKMVEADGRVRQLEVLVPWSEDAGYLVGTALATALVALQKRGWTRRFDESISSHSLMLSFFEEHLFSGRQA